MGWEIVREQHPNNCGKWSRLWQFEDVYHVLTYNKGTHEVEGIMLNKSKQQIPHLDGKSFSSMSKLRLLKISNVDHSEDLTYLSNDLRFLEWDGYPSNSLPSTFQARKLFELNLCHSKIKYLWKGMKAFEKLKNIKLSYSHNLIETPDFTSVPNLEKLNLEGCSRLRELHKSVGFLQRLFMLNLKGCKNLESFPSNIGGLKYCLRTLNLEDCSKLDRLPQNLEVLECLEELNASGTLIRQVPSSIVKLTNLQKLSFRDCRDQPSQTLMSFLWSYMFPQSRNESSMCLRLPSLAGLHSLKSLVLSGCNLSEGTLPNDLDSLASLEKLDLSRNNFVNLPESISRLPKLEILCLRECKRLQSLPELPMAIYFVGTEHCSSLEVISWSTLKKLCTSRNIVLLHLFNCFKLVENQDRENSLAVMLLKLHLRELSFKSVGFHICLPGSEIPAAFKYWSTEGSEIKFGLSPNWYTDEFMGIALCAVVPEVSSELYGLCKCHISCIMEIGSIQMTYHITIPSHVHSDHLWLGYLSIQEMIAIQYSDPNDLRCIHVRVLLFRYYPVHDPLNSVADNRSPIILPAKRYGIRMVYESELENFEEFPAGSNIFQHHGDVCDAPDIHALVPTSDLSPPRIINCESNSLGLRAPSPHILGTQIPTSLSPFGEEFLGRIGEMGGRDDFYREFLGRIGEIGGRDDFYREFLGRIVEMLRRG
ncbi:hypothetical protein LWI29_001969 [Acer saccharum]|uniref:Uncharacterized protein n=1 Tax=Acer saccharum TaxID=4024 RepID=A0AA39VSC8_ACESA|nr:hypothetical protein LWI29_001969 [Acer saccharum]